MSDFPINKYALALHTTTSQLGIAITNFSDRAPRTLQANRTRSQVWDLGRDLAACLHQNLQEIIQPQTWHDLAFIAVAKGPGGFTGTRVGMVTARTIAQQLEIPLFGISTLAAIALSFKQDSHSLLAIQMNARRGELFVAIYQPHSHNRGLVVCLADQIMTVEQWQQTLAQLEQPYQLIEAPENIAATVTNILDLAYLDWQQQKPAPWSEVLPFYGQHPVK